MDIKTCFEVLIICPHKHDVLMLKVCWRDIWN